MVWDEMEPKNIYQSQSFKKYLRLTLVSMLKSTLREKLNFCFQEFFGIIHKIFWYEDWVLGYYSMKFRDIPEIL